MGRQRGARAGTDAEQRAFDPQVLKLVCDELAAEAGVRVLLHTFLVDAWPASTGCPWPTGTSGSSGSAEDSRSPRTVR